MKRFQAKQTQESNKLNNLRVEVSTCVAVGGGQFRACSTRRLHK